MRRPPLTSIAPRRASGTGARPRAAPPMSDTCGRCAAHLIDPGLAARYGRRVPDPVGGRAARQLDQSDADQLSVGGGADLHGDAGGRQPGDTYLGDLLRDRHRLRRRHGARHSLRRAAVVVDLPLSRARSLHRGAERDAEDRAGADLLHLARRRRVDLRDGDRGQRLHHHPDALYRISGHRSGQDQAGAAVWRPRAGRC